MSSRTTLHLPDGRSLPVSRRVLEETLGTLLQGASILLETLDGGLMTSIHTEQGVLLSYRLSDFLPRYKSESLTSEMAINVLDDFSEAGSMWQSQIHWVEVEPAIRSESVRELGYAEARARGRKGLIRYALSRWYGMLLFFGLGILIFKFWGQQAGMFSMGTGLLYEAVAGLTTGDLAWGRITLYREEHTAWFYIVVAFDAVAGLALMILALTQPTS